MKPARKCPIRERGAAVRSRRRARPVTETRCGKRCTLPAEGPRTPLLREHPHAWRDRSRTSPRPWRWCGHEPIVCRRQCTATRCSPRRSMGRSPLLASVLHNARLGARPPARSGFRSGATATGRQAEICRRYGDGASVPLERWGARSPTPDHESCRGVPLPSTTGRCLGW